MNRRILVPAVIAAVSVSALAFSGVYAAANSSENDALAISSAKIDLTKAVAAAEQHVGGKASKAEYERHKGQGVYEIEVVKDKQVMDVKVDASTGSVISAKEDRADKGKDDDDKDE
jgi:uncharacterized membrane protein YkoI